VVILQRRISSSAKLGLLKVLVDVYMSKELSYRMGLVCPPSSFKDMADE